MALALFPPQWAEVAIWSAGLLTVLFPVMSTGLSCQGWERAEKEASWKATKQQVPSSSFCLPDRPWGPECGDAGWGSLPTLGQSEQANPSSDFPKKADGKKVEARKNFQVCFESHLEI